MEFRAVPAGMACGGAAQVPRGVAPIQKPCV